MAKEKRGKDMLNRIIKIILIIAMLGLLAYGAMCVYGNFFASKSGNQTELPEIDEARYAVRISNTGNVLLTNKYHHSNGIYSLDGYWQKEVKGWVYYDNTVVLDTTIFGDIEVKKR